MPALLRSFASCSISRTSIQFSRFTPTSAKLSPLSSLQRSAPTAKPSPLRKTFKITGDSKPPTLPWRLKSLENSFTLSHQIELRYYLTAVIGILSATVSVLSESNKTPWQLSRHKILR